MSYERLDIYEFGTHLLTKNELDPVYVALTSNAHWSDSQLRRWLVAYWCFYNCGFASYASEFEGDDFWRLLAIAAENTTPAPTGDRWPRGRERRHFRGQQGIKAIAELAKQYEKKPEAMVDYITAGAPVYTAVAGRVKEHRGFGDWISFKVCDMTDRVMKIHVDFTEAAVFMFKDPVKAALMFWRDTQKLPENAKPKDQTWVIHKVVETLSDHFSEFLAPPFYDRPVGLQEIETILCCWKSHMNGHYPLFNDIREIREGIAPWIQYSCAAEDFLKAMPPGEEDEDV